MISEENRTNEDAKEREERRMDNITTNSDDSGNLFGVLKHTVKMKHFSKFSAEEIYVTTDSNSNLTFVNNTMSINNKDSNERLPSRASSVSTQDEEDEEHNSSPQVSGSEQQTNTDLDDVSEAATDLKVLAYEASNLSEQEIERKVHGLALSFRTDAMSLKTRYVRRKRQRDQAETSIDVDVETMRSKLNRLRCLCIDANSTELVNDINKQLDVFLASAENVSRSAEAFGYVQYEEKTSSAVDVILQYYDNIGRHLERARTEGSRLLERNRTESSRYSSVDDDREEDKPLRRRSVAAVPFSHDMSRRRASIASIPRPLTPTNDLTAMNTDNIFSLLASNRTTVNKIRTASLTPSRLIVGTSLQSSGDYRRDLKYRKDSRPNEFKTIEQLEDIPEPEDDNDDEDELDTSYTSCVNNEVSLVKRLSRSSKEEEEEEGVVVVGNTGQQSLDITKTFKRVAEVNWQVLKLSRFRWPDNVNQYIRFITTWYIMMILGLTFAAGLTTGRSYTCSEMLEMLQFAGIMSALLTLTCLLRLVINSAIKHLTRLLVLTLALYIVYRLICPLSAPVSISARLDNADWKKLLRSVLKGVGVSFVRCVPL